MVRYLHTCCRHNHHFLTVQIVACFLVFFDFFSFSFQAAKFDLSSISSGGNNLRRTVVQESTGAAQKEDLANYEKLFNDNDGDLRKIATAMGSRDEPARWKDGVTEEYVGGAERFAKLLVEGQLLWSERAPAIGGYAPATSSAGGKESGGGGGAKSNKKQSCVDVLLLIAYTQRTRTQMKCFAAQDI